MDCDCDVTEDRDDSLCDGGCGRDLDEVDGNSFEVELGVVLQLCGPCETAMRNTYNEGAGRA